MDEFSSKPVSEISQQFANKGQTTDYSFQPTHVKVVDKIEGTSQIRARGTADEAHF